MATNQNEKSSRRGISKFKLKLLSGLELAPEARNEEKKPPYPGGRFKRFFDTYKANSGSLMTANGMALIVFMLPLFALIIAVSFIGIEKFAYMLNDVDKTPYLMGGLGIGLSGGMSISEAKVMMLLAYRVLILGVAVCLPIMSFGIAGHAYISTKLIWGERFVCKKDKKTGADVPRIITEFFRGVKIYWKEMLITFAGYAVFFAGGANLIIEFIAGVWSGGASVGQWFALFGGIIILLASTMILLNLFPQVISYHKTLNYAAKLKNACIYSVAFFIPSLLMLVIIGAPFALLAINAMFVRILLAVLLVVFGTTYVVLAGVNYGDYNSENVLQVLYEKLKIDQSRQNRKEKKKPDNVKQQGPVKYKKKK